MSSKKAEFYPDFLLFVKEFSYNENRQYYTDKKTNVKKKMLNKIK